MKNNMYFMAFLGVIAGILILLTEYGRRFLLDTIIRCLFGLVCICFFNDIIAYFGGNISVKINEITACISALFGLSGIAGLYALQLFFTIT